MPFVEIAARSDRGVVTFLCAGVVGFALDRVHDRASIIRLMGYPPTMPRPVDKLREILDC